MSAVEDSRSECELQAHVAKGRVLLLGAGVEGTEYTFCVTKFKGSEKKEVVLYDKKYFDGRSATGRSRRAKRPNKKVHPHRVWSCADLVVDSVALCGQEISLTHTFKARGKSRHSKPKTTTKLRRVTGFRSAAGAAAWADGLICACGGHRRFTAPNAGGPGAAVARQLRDAPASMLLLDSLAYAEAEEEEADATPTLDQTALLAALNTMQVGHLLRLKRGALGTRCWFEVGASDAPRRALKLIHEGLFTSSDRPCDSTARPLRSNKSRHWPLSAIDVATIVASDTAVSLVVGSNTRSGRKVIDGFSTAAQARTWAEHLKLLVAHDAIVVADAAAQSGAEEIAFVSPATITEEGGVVDALALVDWAGAANDHAGETDAWFATQGETANGLGAARLIPKRGTPAAGWFHPTPMPLLPSLADLRRIIGIGPGTVDAMFTKLAENRSEMTCDEFCSISTDVLYLQGNIEAQGLMHHLFNMFDMSRNGKLSRDEARAGFALLGHPADIEATSNALFALFATEDVDSIDTVDLGIFVHGLLQFRRAQTPSAATEEELRILATHEARLIVEDADVDGNGTISKEEFRLFYPRFALEAQAKANGPVALSTFALPSPAVMKKVLGITDAEIPVLLEDMHHELKGDAGESGEECVACESRAMTCASTVSWIVKACLTSFPFYRYRFLLPLLFLSPDHSRGNPHAVTTATWNTTNSLTTSYRTSVSMLPRRSSTFLPWRHS